ERLIRAKKPWALTSAACLLLAAAGLAFAKGIEKAAVSKAEIAREQKRTEGLLAKIKSNVAAVQAKVKERDDAINDLFRIGAGVKERRNWQLLEEYLNLALPLPSGERLTDRSHRGDEVKAKYWDKNAQVAFQKLEALRFTQTSDASANALKADAEFIKKHLIQVNIEGVNALWTDDPIPYFRKIAQDTPNLWAMPAEDR